MLTLEAALYRRLPALSECKAGDAARIAAAFGERLGREIEDAACHVAPEDVSLNLCVSTMIDLPFSSGWLDWQAVVRAASDVTRHPPRNFTASYECAGWGFALDYARRRARPGSRIIVTIADLNLLDLSFWRSDPNWGVSGFGISTVVFRVPVDGQFPLHAKVAQSSYGMGEFCVDLRGWMAQSRAHYANVPFLPPEMAQIYGRFLDERRLMPNLNDRFGHCFGSDTWVSFLDHAARGLLEPGGIYTATCASLRGYWAITDLAIAADARLDMRDGETDSRSPLRVLP
ncbi:hypothetical protein ACT2FY_00760 [Paraburkholderia fungorum]|uniref:hypothetical protein n=1 Tax=Paraburkholderia fungorum TaxID=134537 RepID=UPI00402B1193